MILDKRRENNLYHFCSLEVDFFSNNDISNILYVQISKLNTKNEVLKKIKDCGSLKVYFF